jgi:drug/metabolite transporter (DMT)-like permease
MIYLPILASIALAGGTIFERTMLKKKSMDVGKYHTIEFLGIVIIMLPILYFFWKLDPQALELKNILIFVGVVILSIIANIFTFYSMKGEKISNLEPAKMLEPLFTILLALLFNLFFRGIYESNPKMIIPAVIAGLALILTHVKKEHLSFNKYFLAAIAGSFFFALELIVSNLILDFYSPVTFYFLRCLAIVIISIILFRPNLSKIEGKLKIKMLLIGAVWVFYRVATYYGYVKIGIISTTLILMLSVLFVYLFAKIFLKEKISTRNIIASIIILACILYANFM